MAILMFQKCLQYQNFAQFRGLKVKQIRYEIHEEFPLNLLTEYFHLNHLLNLSNF